MLKILFWSNEKWRDEAPNRLVRRREPAGGHFIPSQMAAHDANSGSGPICVMRSSILAIPPHDADEQNRSGRQSEVVAPLPPPIQLEG